MGSKADYNLVADTLLKAIGEEKLERMGGNWINGYNQAVEDIASRIKKELGIKEKES